MWKDVMKQNEIVKDMLLGNYETPHFSRAWHAVFWMNHHSEIQLDSGCRSLVMTDILQQLIGIYHRDQSVLHRCCKILVYFKLFSYILAIKSITCHVPPFCWCQADLGRWLLLSKEAQGRTADGLLHLFSPNIFWSRPRVVIEASCLRNIWNYIIHDQDLRSSVTCWAMCGVLCAWKKCITPWITVVAIGPCGK